MILSKRFAADEWVLKELDIVQICVKGKLKTINTYIEALRISFICSPILNQNIDFSEKSAKHLICLHLADTYDNNNKPLLLCGQSRINSTKQGASNMTNLVTSHNSKINCEVINPANGDMTLKNTLIAFGRWKPWVLNSIVFMRLLRMKSILTDGVISQLYLLNLITNQYWTILSYQSIVYIHLEINQTETQIWNESSRKSFRIILKRESLKKSAIRDTRKNSLFAPQTSRATRQRNNKSFHCFRWLSKGRTMYIFKWSSLFRTIVIMYDIWYFVAISFTRVYFTVGH